MLTEKPSNLVVQTSETISMFVHMCKKFLSKEGQIRFTNSLEAKKIAVQ